MLVIHCTSTERNGPEKVTQRGWHEPELWPVRNRNQMGWEKHVQNVAEVGDLKYHLERFAESGLDVKS